METVFMVLRWVHVSAASAWFGEVVVVNFILIPVVAQLQGEMRSKFVTTLFPRVFNLASILSLTAVVTGLILLYMKVDGDFSLLLRSFSGKALLFGAVMGTLLTLFHFFMENKLAAKIGIVKKSIEGSAEELEDVHTKLKIVPRLGMVVITSIFLSMMIAAHGFF